MTFDELLNKACYSANLPDTARKQLPNLSHSHDPKLKGVPKGWRLPVRDILEYGGAKFLCPMAGTISMMPGTGSNPAYRRVDVDTETGNVLGLF